jgi:hypothetical protein
MQYFINTSIASTVKVILSNELINLRKGIGAIFYQHFHCIDSKALDQERYSDSQIKTIRFKLIPYVLKQILNSPLLVLSVTN